MPDYECQNVLRFLENYLAGTLTAVELRDFESHVNGCSACQGEIAAERTLVGLVRKAVELDTPPANALISRIRQKLAEEKS